MNVVKIYGGLGNQMFQYAFGKAIEKNGLPVTYEISWYNKPQEVIRPFHLNRFRLTLKIGTFSSDRPTIHEKEFYRFVPNHLQRHDANFFGYWQNRKYLESVLPELKDEFRVNPGLYTEEYLNWKGKILSSDNSVSLHIRRGDYLTKGHHLLPLSYYTDCLKYLMERFDNLSIFIFSDDIAWCKENIKNVEGYIDLEDYLCLDLMRMCTHKITANSTFSWWAGILGEKENSITFAPIRWRLNDEEESVVSEEKFVPDNWIRL